MGRINTMSQKIRRDQESKVSTTESKNRLKKTTEFLKSNRTMFQSSLELIENKYPNFLMFGVSISETNLF